MATTLFCGDKPQTWPPQYAVIVKNLTHQLVAVL